MIQSIEQQPKTGTNASMTTMVAFRLCCPIFTLWCMWWGSTHLLVSTQITNANFEMEKGIRYGCGITSNRSAGSVIECAAECAKEKACYGFNFRFTQCQLLSATADERITAPGWIHGCYPPGKYQGRYQLNPDYKLVW